jgi:hypothetical protein
MALALLDEVALINGDLVSSPDPFLRNGNILFGRVIEEAASVVNVLWENGTVSENITNAAGGPLDKIVSAATTVADDIQGRVVYPLPVGAGEIMSAEYRCIVVRVYRRQRDGAGDLETFALLRNLQTGQMFETVFGNVTLIPGQ